MQSSLGSGVQLEPGTHRPSEDTGEVKIVRIAEECAAEEMRGVGWWWLGLVQLALLPSTTRTDSKLVRVTVPGEKILCRYCVDIVYCCVDIV